MTDPPSSQLARLTEAFTEGLREGWRSESLGRERFGSWEWLGQQEYVGRAEPRRWVIFALTPLSDEEDGVGRLHTEFWIAAEYRERYMRARTGQLTVDATGDAASALGPVVTANTAASAAQAELVNPADVQEEYPALEQVPPATPERLAADIRPRPSRAELRRDLPQLARNQPGITAGAVAEALGATPAAVAAVLLQLVESGEIAIRQAGREVRVFPPERELRE